MDMSITPRIKGPRMILSVKGDLVGPAVAEFMIRLESLQESEYEEVWVDLGKVSAIDSKAFGAAAYSHIVLTKASKRLVFLAPSNIKDHFCACNLDRVLNIVNLEDIVSPDEIAPGLTESIPPMADAERGT